MKIKEYVTEYTKERILKLLEGRSELLEVEQCIQKEDKMFERISSRLADELEEKAEYIIYKYFKTNHS